MLENHDNPHMTYHMHKKQKSWIWFFADFRLFSAHSKILWPNQRNCVVWWLCIMYTATVSSALPYCSYLLLERVCKWRNCADVWWCHWSSSWGLFSANARDNDALDPTNSPPNRYHISASSGEYFFRKVGHTRTVLTRNKPERRKDHGCGWLGWGSTTEKYSH